MQKRKISILASVCSVFLLISFSTALPAVQARFSPGRITAHPLVISEGKDRPFLQQLYTFVCAVYNISYAFYNLSSQICIEGGKFAEKVRHLRDVTGQILKKLINLPLSLAFKAGEYSAKGRVILSIIFYVLALIAFIIVLPPLAVISLIHILLGVISAAHFIVCIVSLTLYIIVLISGMLKTWLEKILSE